MSVVDELTPVSKGILIEFIKATIIEDSYMISVSDLHEKIKATHPNIPSIFLRRYLNPLIDAKIVEILKDDRAVEYIRANENFRDELYEISVRLGLYVEPKFEIDTPQSNVNVAEAVPASDRFVTIDHNSEEFRKADETLDALISAVQNSNELDLPPEERAIVVDEIGAIKRAIAQARVRVASIWEATRDSGAIGWLSKQAASGAVQAAAAVAVAALLSLVGLL